MDTNENVQSVGFKAGRAAYYLRDRENPFEPGTYEYEDFWDGICHEREARDNMRLDELKYQHGKQPTP